MLLLQATEPSKQPLRWEWLIENDSSDMLLIDDLLFGDVWFFMGGMELKRTLAKCKDYRYVPESSKSSQETQLDFIRFGIQSADPVQDDRLQWLKAGQSQQQDLPAIYYYFSLAYSRKKQVPVGIIDLCRDAEEGVSVLTLCQNKAVFTSVFRALYKQEICGCIWYLGREDMLQTKQFAQYFGKFWSYLAKYINPGNDPCIAVFPQLKTIPYNLREPGGPSRLMAFNLLLKRLIEETHLTAAAVPVYDLSLQYMNEQGQGNANLPLYAQKEGERLSAIAQALLEKRLSELPPRFLEASCLKQHPQALAVRFTDFHLALQAKQRQLKGFLIAGAQGQFQPARAFVTSPDTVLLWHPDIPHPKHCGYAYYLGNEQSGLQDHRSLPALPFITALPQELPKPQLWLDLSEEFVWGMRSQKEGSAAAMPCDLPLYRWPTGVQVDFLNERQFPPLKIQEFTEVYTVTSALQVNYRRYTAVEMQQLAVQKKLSGQVLWGPAGPYAYPAMPDFTPYRALTVFVYNPDRRPQKIFLNRLAGAEIDTLPSWQAVCFRLPRKMEWLDLESGFLLVADEAEKRLNDGTLLFARMDLWQNEDLAWQYVKTFNQQRNPLSLNT